MGSHRLCVAALALVLGLGAEKAEAGQILARTTIDTSGMEIVNVTFAGSTGSYYQRSANGLEDREFLT